MANSVAFDPYGFFNQKWPLNQVNWAAYFSPTIPDGIMSGIGNEMEVYANSSGMNVRVKTGECRVRSHRGLISAETALDIEAADATYNRYDLVVARVTYGSPSTMVVTVKTGTANAAPEVPALTQTAGDVWEIPLAVVSVTAAAVTIAATDVTDKRFVYKTGNDAVLIFAGTSLSVKNDIDHRSSETSIGSLAITLPDNPPDTFITGVCFDSASSFSGVTFTKGGTTYYPKLVGAALTLASKRYNLTIWWDGAYYWCSTEAA
ncbi:MAG: hypothetical protein IJI07_01295 [Flexilinea sp.]|nr:hypothetical protein [Flexilinea sp.]